MEQIYINTVDIKDTLETIGKKLNVINNNVEEETRDVQKDIQSLKEEMNHRFNLIFQALDRIEIRTQLPSTYGKV